MHTRRLLLVAVLMTALLLFAQACSDEKPEKVALQVARDWTSSNVSQVASELGVLVTNDLPILRDLAAFGINQQIRDKLTWTYSEPVKVSKGRYRVVATVSSDINVNLVLVQQDYRISADLVLSVDTGEKQVQSWGLDFGSFSVTEQ